MNKTIEADLKNLWVTDRTLQNKAFSNIMEITEKPVDWAYEAWDEAIKNVGDKDNHNRAIAAQVLCNLAKSDPKERILKDFKALINITKDERFVTARHCMQALWKVGIVGVKQQKIYMAGLETRFMECIKEKNCTLIRYDILQSMRNVFDATKDESIRTKALELIQTEEDIKYEKKYRTLWKSK